METQRKAVKDLLYSRILLMMMDDDMYMYICFSFYVTMLVVYLLCLSILTAILAGGCGLASTRTSPFWIYWS